MTKRKLHGIRSSTASPEYALAIAVVHQAIEDLSSPEIDAQLEARSFFRGEGAYRRMRDYWLTVVGLDVEAVLYRLRDRLEEPIDASSALLALTKCGTLDGLPDRVFFPEDLTDASIAGEYRKQRLKELVAAGYVRGSMVYGFRKVTPDFCVAA